MIFFWLMMICCGLCIGCLIYDLRKDNDPQIKLLATATLVVVFYILFHANYRPQEKLTNAVLSSQVEGSEN